MPTDIERSCLDQGYRLPQGLSWAMIGERRARWRIAPIFGPVAVAPDCVGWGVLYIGGKPIRRA